MFWNNWKKSQADKLNSRKSNLRFEALEERQLLTAVGYVPPAENLSSVGAVLATSEDADEAIDLGSLTGNDTSDPVVTITCENLAENTARVGYVLTATVENANESLQGQTVYTWYRSGEKEYIGKSYDPEYYVTMDDYGCELTCVVFWSSDITTGYTSNTVAVDTQNIFVNPDWIGKDLPQTDALKISADEKAVGDQLKDALEVDRSKTSLTKDDVITVDFRQNTTTYDKVKSNVSLNYAITDTINVTDVNLTINASYAGDTYVTINGNEKTGILNVAQGAGLTVNNLTFQNGKTTNGGAIYNAGTLTVNNSLFHNNNATNGGAIYNVGALTLGNNNVFVQNKATENGGAIYNAENATLTISNTTTFTDNYSRTETKANADGKPVSYTLNATSGNSASVGGAIYNVGTANINGTVTAQGAVATKGGVIANYGKVTTNADLTFGAKDHANGSDSAQGGAIYNAGTFTVESGKLTVQYGKASDGGAIYNAKRAFTVDEFGTLDVSYNTVATEGGAIYNAAEFTVNGTLSAQNNGSTGTNGGAYYGAANGVLNIDTNDDSENGDKAKFAGNVAKNGGAIYLEKGSALNVKDAAILKASSNYATTNGGAIYNAGTTTFAPLATVTLASNGYQNSITTNGGAIYNAGELILEEGQYDEENNLLTDVQVKEAEENGTDVFAYGAWLEANNNYAVNGGAIYNAGTTTISANAEAYFVGNGGKSLADGKDVKLAGEYGGAIYNAEKANLTVSGYLVAQKNQAENGGAIYNAGTADLNGQANLGIIVEASLNEYDEPVFTVKGDSDEGNVAKKQYATATGGTETRGCGGAVYNAASGDLTIDGDFYATGNSSVNGGAIANYGKLTLNSTDAQLYLNANTADNAGGIIYNAATGDNALTLKNDLTLSDGKATYGGAIANYGTFNVGVETKGADGLLVADEVTLTLTNNSARYGGAFFNYGDVEFYNAKGEKTGSIVNGVVSGLINDADAVAKKVNTATLNVYGGLVAETNEATFGGAVANYGDVVIQTGAYAGFAYNGDSDQDGNADMDGSVYKIAYGGAFCNFTGATLTIEEDATFSAKYNFAQSGGAVMNYGRVDVLGSTDSYDGGHVILTGNGAQKNGGAVYNTWAMFPDSEKDESGSWKKFYPDEDAARGTWIVENGAEFKATSNNARDGGAVANHGYMSFTTDSDYEQATVSFTGNSALSDGGAYLGYGTLIVDGGASFTENAAVGEGGAIFASSYESSVCGNIVIKNGAWFEDNTAGENGGAISAIGSKISIGVQAEGEEQDEIVTFKNNTTNGGGSAINIEVDSEGKIGENIEFIGGEAKLGGLIRNNGTLTIQDMSFDTSEDTSRKDSVILNTEKGDLTIIDSSFQGNGTISDTDARATKGGAIQNAGKLTLSGEDKFIGNTADLGGAIYNYDGGTITIADKDTTITFSDNVAWYGGAIYFENKKDEAAALSGVLNLEGNYASKDGGAIYVNKGSLTVSGELTIDGKEKTNAGSDGGAIYLNSATFTAEGAVTIKNSTAGDKGGGIYLNNSTFTGWKVNDEFTSEVKVESNNAKIGGAVFSTGESEFSPNATLTSNTASEYGGAIYVDDGAESNLDDGNSKLTIGGVVVATGNEALDGGAIYVAEKDGETTGGQTTVVGTLTLTNNDVSDAKANANSGEFYNGGKATFAVGSVVTITKDATGDAALSGLYNDADASLTVAGSLTISNQKANSGAAIYNLGDAEFVDGYSAIFKDNSVVDAAKTTGVGGAVYNAGTFATAATGTLSVTGSKAYQGGAFYNKGNMTLAAKAAETNGAIEGNTSENNGGAVYNCAGATLTIGGDFGINSNMASGNYGGAIYNAGEATIEGGNFAGNEAKRYGGAVYNASTGVLTFQGTSTFSNNGATSYGTSVRSQGGALLNDGGKVYFEAVTTTAAKTNENGEFIDKNGDVVDSADQAAQVTVTVPYTVTFDGNYASDGGAIHNRNKGELTFQADGASVVFTDNKADYVGAALDVCDGATATVANATFVNNDVKANEKFGSTNAGNAGNGGAIYNSATLILDGKVNISESDADKYGGAIFSTSSVTVKGELSTVGENAVGNTAQAGGAIYVGSGSSFKFDGGSAILNGNEATNGAGGAIYNAGTVSGFAGTLNDNTAYASGGAIYNVKGAKFAASGDLTANGNEATNGDGGAVYNAANVAFTVGGNATFNANEATNGDGGAVYNAANVTFTVDGNASFGGSAQTGGAVYNTGATFDEKGETKTAAVSFSVGGNATFNGASATENGGAIYNGQNVNFEVKGDATFKDVEAFGDGGAIYNEANVAFTVGGNASFTNGSAQTGGAIYNATGVTFSVAKDATFNGSEATNGVGGAIYNATGVTFDVDGKASFANSVANAGGGAIYNAANVTFNVGGNATFDGSEATNGVGGAIYNAENVKFTVKGDATFDDAAATGAGGAIYNAAGVTFDVDGKASFANGVANVGGAVYNAAGVAFTVASASFANSEATNGDGGAIYNGEGAKFTVETGDASFVNSFAKNGKGGAIYNANGASFTVSENGKASFVFSQAKAGGAVYNDQATFTLAGSSYFNGNKATTGDGGAIWTKTQNVTETAVPNYKLADESTEDTVQRYKLNEDGSYVEDAEGGYVFDKYTYDYKLVDAGSISLNNAEFYANSAQNGNGGAIYNAGGSLTVGGNSAFGAEKLAQELLDENGNVVLADNGQTLYKVDETQGYVQAKNEDGSLKFDADNKLVYETLKDANGADVTLNGKVIYQGVAYVTKDAGNTATNGGAYYGYATSTQLNDDKTATKTELLGLEEQTAPDFYAASLTIGGNANFSFNDATNNKGGAIFNMGALEFNGNATFKSNKATQNGGAIFNGCTADTYVAAATLTVKGDLTMDSNSGRNGGAITNYGTVDITSDATSVKFEKNTAKTYGGAFYNLGTLVISSSDVEFTGNTAGSTSTKSAQGGAVYNYAYRNDRVGDIQIKSGANVAFTQNKAIAADSYGGAISLGRVGKTNGTTSDNNEFDSIVKASTLSVESGATLNFGAESNTDSGNSARYGGALYVMGDAYVKDGKVVQLTDAAVTFDGALNFYYNKAEASDGAAIGGAIFANANVQLNGASAFTGNSAQTTNVTEGVGGAIAVPTLGSLTINADLTASDNSADFGGAVGSFGAVTITDKATATFENNTADLDGGAYFNFNSFVSEGKLTFSGNTASGNGGAISNAVLKADKSSPDDVEEEGNYSFIGNIAFNKGTVEFSNNSATKGGAIKSSGKLSADGAAVTFKNNTANKDGGALQLAMGSVTTLNETVFTGNKATEGDGGAVFSLGTLTISGENGQFNSNSAGRNGGAICNGSYMAHLNLNFGSFYNNVAGNKGGAVYNDYNSELMIAEITASGNKLKDGTGSTIYANSNKGGLDRQDSEYDTMFDDNFWDLIAGDM